MNGHKTDDAALYPQARGVGDEGEEGEEGERVWRGGGLKRDSIDRRQARVMSRQSQ